MMMMMMMIYVCRSKPNLTPEYISTIISIMTFYAHSDSHLTDVCLSVKKLTSLRMPQQLFFYTTDSVGQALHQKSDAKIIVVRNNYHLSHVTVAVILLITDTRFHGYYILWPSE